MGDAEEPGASLLDPETLRRLLRQLEATDIDEFEITLGTSRLFLRREPGQRTVLVSGTTRQETTSPGIPVVAPLTGVYYSRPAPEQAEFVRPGDLVEPGQIVALIETMKLFNEVIAELAGEVTSITVGDGDLVEAGQPLLYIRPREEEETL